MKRKKRNCRSLENPAVPLTDPMAYEYLVGHKASSGVSVSSKSILGIPAIWRGINLVSQKVAKLPLTVYQRVNDGREIAKRHPAYLLLKSRPNSEMNAYVWRQTMQYHAMVFGNGFSYIFRNQAGDTTELVILDPESTYPVRENGVLLYLTTINGQDRKLLAENVIHLKGLSYDGLSGWSVIDVLKESLGLSQAVQKYTSVYFQNAGKPSVVITLPSSLKDPEKIERFRKTWGDIHRGLDNSHRPALLENGATITPLGGDNEASQLVELSDKQIVAAANILGVPPSYLGVSDSYTSHNSLEQQTQQFLADTLDGWLTAWESELDFKLLRESEKQNDTHYIEFNRNALLQTDMKTMHDVLIMQMNNNGISWEEYRQKLNLPVEKAGTYFRLANVQVLGSDFAPEQPEQPDQPAEQPDQAANSPDQQPAEADSGSDAAPDKARADALAKKAVKRLLNRVKRAVEAGKTDCREHRDVFLDNLDCFPDAASASDAILDAIAEEISVISRADISNINWEHYETDLLRRLTHGKTI